MGRITCRRGHAQRGCGNVGGVSRREVPVQSPGRGWSVQGKQGKWGWKPVSGGRWKMAGRLGPLGWSLLSLEQERSRGG